MARGQEIKAPGAEFRSEIQRVRPQTGFPALLGSNLNSAPTPPCGARERQGATRVLAALYRMDYALTEREVDAAGNHA